MAVDGEFEFGAMQNTFNEMAEELERAKRNKELQVRLHESFTVGMSPVIQKTAVDWGVIELE